MAVKKILTEPNSLLRQVSKAVEKVGKEEQQLMNDMLETMYSANGIGLAAIQIGVPKRIIVMDISKEENKKEPKLNKKIADLNFTNEQSYKDFKQNAIEYGKISSFPKLD